ncbi:hypothetical protein J4E91_006842 [Alternaria rosae]|nr:hypothetical protein J4E91_006842 [Alternaria rosae]
MGIVELWTLYALAVSFTFLRTHARITAVGLSELQVDDYLVWIAILIYTAQCSLGYSLGVHVHGLANDGMTPNERDALSQDDPEFNMRVIGSKIQVAGWTTAACLLWSLKLCVAAFYLRLTAGLGMYTTRIRIAFASIITTFVIIIFTIYFSCRPFWHYWQISPDPGNSCQAAVSKPLIWVTFVFNVSTDVYLLLIPIPMLWKSRLRTYKKIAAMLVLGSGMLVIVCATPWLWPLMRKILLSSRLVKLVIAEACFKSRELVELVDAEGYLAKGDLGGWIRCNSVTLKGRQSSLLSLWFIKNEDLGDVFKDRLA